MTDPTLYPDDDLISAAAVRRKFGKISKMTLWRWVADPDLSFPQPTKIRGRNYWSSHEILAAKDRLMANREAGSNHGRLQ